MDSPLSRFLATGELPRARAQNSKDTPVVRRSALGTTQSAKPPPRTTAPPPLVPTNAAPMQAMRAVHVGHAVRADAPSGSVVATMVARFQAGKPVHGNVTLRHPTKENEQDRANKRVAAAVATTASTGGAPLAERMERWQQGSAGDGARQRVTKAAEPLAHIGIPLRDRIARYQQATQGELITCKPILVQRQPATKPAATTLRVDAVDAGETSAVAKYARQCLQGLAAVELHNAKEQERARALAALLYDAAQL